MTTDTTPTVNRRNLRHGLRTTALLPWEDEAEHAQLVDEVEGYLRPTNPAEIEIVRHFAGLMWRLRRVTQAEAAQFAASQRRAEAWKAMADAQAACTDLLPAGREARPSPAVVLDAGQAALTGIASANLGLIERYEASLQRAARRQLFLLSAMRRLRGGLVVVHPTAGEVLADGEPEEA